MIIVAGHLVVDPKERDTFLAGSASVVEQARRAEGCLDFAMSGDLLDAGRINILERWASKAAVEAFRGSGPSAEQGAAIRSASVSEYEVSSEKDLFSGS